MRILQPEVLLSGLLARCVCPAACRRTDASAPLRPTGVPLAPAAREVVPHHFLCLSIFMLRGSL